MMRKINWNDSSKKTVVNQFYGRIDIVTEEEARTLWKELEETLKKKRNFIDPNQRIFKSYIDNLGEVVIKKDACNLYRARKNERERQYTKKDLMAPPWYICKSGRLNPVGISYLYLSDSIETCCAEVRPWIGAKITIAKFYPAKDLILKDLRITKQEREEEISPKRLIKQKFSKPVTQEEGELDYLITQCITEYIKDFSNPVTSNFKSYDGIIYESSANKDGYKKPWVSDTKLLKN